MTAKTMTNHQSMIRRMRISNRVKLVSLCMTAAIVAACATEEAPGPLEPTGPQGRVRLVNLITDATRGRVNASLEGIVFTVDLQYGQTAPANLPAPATAPYAAVYTGDRSFVLKRTADTTVTVATLNFSIADTQDLTVYAIGGAGGSAITRFLTTDTNPTPVAGETRLRIVNGSPSAGAVDVFITAVGADLSTATARATNLAYQGASAYFPVAPGTYQIRAVPTGTAPANRVGTAITINLASTAFTSASARTIVLADNATGGTPLRAVVIVDR
jgi:hypothetical protein